MILDKMSNSQTGSISSEFSGCKLSEELRAAHQRERIYEDYIHECLPDLRRRISFLRKSNNPFDQPICGFTDVDITDLPSTSQQVFSMDELSKPSYIPDYVKFDCGERCWLIYDFLKSNGYLVGGKFEIVNRRLYYYIYLNYN